jgi:hypothetical protein
MDKGTRRPPNRAAELWLSCFVMAGHSPSETGVNALMPGHPRLAARKKDVDARHKAGHDGV